MKLYHFCSSEYGLENISKQRLKVSLISELNDPFDMLAVAGETSVIRSNLNEWREDFALTRGIVCFSRSWNNPVQWSHYADRHKGICLGFDVADKYCMPVKYVRNRINIMNYVDGHGHFFPHLEW